MKVNAIYIIGGFRVAQLLSPPKYMEAPLDGARFVVPLDELIGETFQKFIGARIESMFRRAELDRRLWGMFGVDINAPVRIAK